jgi:peptidase E
MEEYLRNFIVYPFDRALCLKWAEVSDCARRNGRPIQCADAWIAATAVLHRIPLVTHNDSSRTTMRSYLLAQDVIYVGGGNTKSMLAVWREWGVPELLREAWESGIVLAGISAGAICWFEQGITDSFADQLRVIDCLGFLPGSCCPHYNGEPERRPAYQWLLRQGEIASGIAIDDGAAIHYTNDQGHRVVASRKGATVYRVYTTGMQVREEAMPVEYLAPATTGA